MLQNAFYTYAKKQEATASLSSLFYNFSCLAEKYTNLMVNFTDKNGNYGFFFLIKEVSKMGNIIVSLLQLYTLCVI